MPDKNCPLCRSSRLIEAARHDTDMLASKYQALFKFDTHGYYPEKAITTYRCVNCDLRFHHPALPGDSHFYNKMQEHPFYYENEKPEFLYAINKIIELRPDNILEVGAGDGKFLRKICNAYKVKAREYSSKSIEKLQQHGIQLDEINSSEQFDLIVSFQVLEHVEDVRLFLQEAADKLKENGHLLITVPNNDSRYYQERFAILDYPPHHMTQWSRKALENIGELFNLQQVDYYEEPHRIEHYMGLIKGRRIRLKSSGIKGALSRLASAALDNLIAPYMFDQVNYAGQTHGILLMKSAEHQ